MNRKKIALVILIAAMIMAGCTVCLPTPRGTKCLTCSGGVCQAAYTIYCKFPPRPGGSQ